MYTIVGTYFSFLDDWNNPTRTTDSHLKRLISTSFCILGLHLLMMGLDTPETCRG